MKIINLLPKPRQEELYFEQMLSRLVMVLWLSLASFLLVFGVQLGTRIYLERELSKVSADSDALKSQVNKSGNEQLKKTIKGINDYITDFKKLSNTPKWSRVLEAFAALPPAEVGITSFNLDFKNKSVVIQGFAASREDVKQLYDNILADEKNFYGVDYYFENIARPKNNEFHFSFFIKDELLQ